MNINYLLRRLFLPKFPPEDDCLNPEFRLATAKTLTVDCISREFGRLKSVKVLMKENEGPNFSSEKPFLITIPKILVEYYDINHLVKLLLHEYGHFVFTLGRAHQQREFKKSFLKGRNDLSRKEDWENSYPTGNFFIPNFWRKDYIDYLGQTGLAIRAYATKHPEEEWADIFAALCDHSFEIKIPEGKDKAKLLKKIECVKNIVRNNKYLRAR